MRRGARFAFVCAATMLAVSCGGADDRRPPAPGDQGGRATILYQDRVVEVARTLNDANDLWVVPEDLPRINDFILKPEGACLDELCIPVRQDRESEMYVNAPARAGSTSPAWRGGCSRSSSSIASTASGASAASRCHATPSCRRRRRRISRSRPGRQDGQPVRLPGEEGPHRDLGLLVRLPL